MTIIELELLSDDLTETEKFYKKILGLEPYRREEDKTRIFFMVGGTKLIFKKSDNVKPVYHFAIDVPTNRFFDSHDFVKSLIPIIPANGDDIANFVNWDAKSFYFYDNNGNILEFITRYPNKEYYREAFSSRCYIGISEIGLVTNNVPELAGILKNEYGVPIFHRQPAADNFTASGDDCGLFILVEKNRDWFPTTIKAKAFSTRVVFMEGGNVSHIIT
jgi:catechol-2,3-dioxygenase